MNFNEFMGLSMTREIHRPTAVAAIPSGILGDPSGLAFRRSLLQRLRQLAQLRLRRKRAKWENTLETLGKCGKFYPRGVIISDKL